MIESHEKETRKRQLERDVFLENEQITNVLGGDVDSSRFKRVGAAQEPKTRQEQIREVTPSSSFATGLEGVNIGVQRPTRIARTRLFGGVEGDITEGKTPNYYMKEGGSTTIT